MDVVDGEAVDGEATGPATCTENHFRYHFITSITETSADTNWKHKNKRSKRSTPQPHD